MQELLVFKPQEHTVRLSGKRAAQNSQSQTRSVKRKLKNGVFRTEVLSWILHVGDNRGSSSEVAAGLPGP